MTQKDLMDILARHSEQALEIAKERNSGYSTDANPFKNLEASDSINIKPEHAILVRMLDKMSRISVLLTKELSTTQESLADNCLDIMNYANLLWAMIEQKKKDK